MEIKFLRIWVGSQDSLALFPCSNIKTDSNGYYLTLAHLGIIEYIQHISRTLTKLLLLPHNKLVARKILPRSVLKDFVPIQGLAMTTDGIGNW